MGQSEPTPSELLTPRTAREDGKQEQEHGARNHRHREVRGLPAEQDAHAEGDDPERGEQYDGRPPADADPPKAKPMEQLPDAGLATQQRDEPDGQRRRH